ncbi:unnamed protein product [Dibothriocephalus latus]|uniref:carbonic anhydrase n=1 Tax=Dibothriocephalus latus TaxID=60516 RepID=A0A3P7LA71_DIBLA|nr:unnamed protein product [Dibothriocephalus latus]
MHIVGYSSIYDNAAQAKPSPAGLTVIGVFFKMTNEPAESSLSKMGNLLSAIGSLTNARSTANVSYFDPKVLLPENKEFFRYQGSLTTPPCTENVQWTMLRHALHVTEADLKKLRSLRFGDSDGGKPMQDNFRPVQPLTAEQAPQPRVLYKSWSSASTHLAAGLCMIILGITFSSLSN